MTRWMGSLAALGLLGLLAGCGGGGKAKPPVTRMQTMLDAARVVATKLDAGIDFMEARGIAEEGATAKSMDDVKSWQFLFSLDKEREGTIIVPWSNGAFGEPTITETSVNGDVAVHDAPILDFDQAVSRLKPAGFVPEFDTVAYRQPMDLVNKEASYIFHLGSARQFVFVGSQTGVIRTQSDHANLVNELIANTLEFTKRKFARAQLFTLDADVHWSEGTPSVNFWHLEFNDPATNPATTLTMDYQPGNELPDPVVEHRTLTGFSGLADDLALDPADAITKLNDAGYSDEFDTIGVRWPAGQTEPVYRFTFGSPKFTVLVGAMTGKVTRL